jgi:hypothetical protein
MGRGPSTLTMVAEQPTDPAVERRHGSPAPRRRPTTHTDTDLKPRPMATLGDLGPRLQRTALRRQRPVRRIHGATRQVLAARRMLSTHQHPALVFLGLPRRQRSTLQLPERRIRPQLLRP